MAHKHSRCRVLTLLVCISIFLSFPSAETEETASASNTPVSPEPSTVSGQNATLEGSSLGEAARSDAAAPEQPLDPNQLTIRQIFDSIRFENAPPADAEISPSDVLLSGNENLVGQSIGNMLISLAFVILIGLMIAWFARRYVVRDSNLGGGRINLLASYTLSQKSKVYLIRIGSQAFLVGEGGNELNLISEVNLHSSPDAARRYEVSDEENHPNPSHASESFESKLNQWTSALKSKDMHSEVNASLLLLGGLAQRLRNKRES